MCLINISFAGTFEKGKKKKKRFVESKLLKKYRMLKNKQEMKAS